MEQLASFSVLDEYGGGLDEFPDFYSPAEETFSDVWENCVILSVVGVVPVIFKIVSLNFIFGILKNTGLFSSKILHLCTASIGIYLTTTLESPACPIIVLLCCITLFILLRLSYFLRHTRLGCANLLKITCIVYIVLCEYYLIDPGVWNQVRGIVMVLAMKIISLGEDIERHAQGMPSYLEFFGYTLCGANVMFGPWISFENYLNVLYRRPIKKNLAWVLIIVQVVATSVFFLTVSNCWIGYFLTDDSNRWFLSFREAQSFRASHYFISYMAEAGMIASGLLSETNLYKHSSFTRFRCVITDPLEIEFPSSLSVVVRKWNKPMHDFLKKYIFRSLLLHGRFCAIVATFVVSSLLHGFEMKVSAILISLGYFSYLQVAAREKLAESLSICINVRPCKRCDHKYKRDSFQAKVMLILYSFATVFHLAYLGVLMDPSTNKMGIYAKWESLSFASHLIMLVNVLVIL